MIQTKWRLQSDTHHLPFVPFKRSWSRLEPQDRRSFWLVAMAMAIPLVLLLPWLMHREAKSLHVEPGLASALPLLQNQLDLLENEATIALPQGWQAVQFAGATAYVAPAAEVPVVPVGRTWTGGSAFGGSAPVSSLDSFDGTRQPYITDVSFQDLKQVAPGRYSWSGVWEGEGYNRLYEQRSRLVSPREGGADIWLNVSWDATITDPTQPNFVVTIESDQDHTAQVTNFSAFLTDPASGQTRDRIDFGQLPPFYDVTLTRDGLDAETKTLQPLGRISFAYHVTPDQIQRYLPLHLEATNQFFDQRLKQFAELESQGWVIKEVPPPSFAKPS